MWNVNTNYKRFIICIAFFFIIISYFPINLKSVVFAVDSVQESEIMQTIDDNVDEMLNSIDSSEIDSYIIDVEDNLKIFENFSFKSMVTNLIDGTFSFEIDDILSYIQNKFLLSIKEYYSIILSLFVAVIIYEFFNIFCIDKYIQIKKIVKIIFNIQVTLVLAILLKSIANNYREQIDKIFSFTETLFPILLNLLLLSGATGTHSVTSTLSVFVINTTAYIFKFVLFPLATSIVLISIFSSLSVNSNLQKVSNILKSIFKTIIVCLFAIFSLFSTLNFIISGLNDGLGIKLTKYAIKNYVPILGGYVSEGFDFVKSCAVLIKNGFGIVGIFVLFSIVIKSIILNLIVYFSFKILSLMSAFVNSNNFSSLFDNFANSLLYFFSVLIGIFLILFFFIFLVIVSVSVI